MEELVCVLHVGDGAWEGKISLFTEHSLAKVNQCLFWRKRIKTSKYKTIIDNFPQSIELYHGFHQNFYKLFTAIKEPPPQLEESSSSPQSSTEHTVPPNFPFKRPDLRSSATPIQTKGGTGVLCKKCIFCKKETKVANYKKERLVQCQTAEIEASIRNDVKILEDDQILMSVGNKDFVAAEVHYHNSCRKYYRQRAISKSESDKSHTSWHATREAHSAAFVSIVDFVKKHIILDKQIVLLAELHERYIALCSEFGVGIDSLSTYTQQHLEEKLGTHFKDEVTFNKSSSRQGTLVFSKNINVNDAIRTHYDASSTDCKLMVQRVGYMLRQEILKMDKNNKYGEPFNIDKLETSDDHIPELVTNFFDALIGGPQFKIRTPKVARRINSISQDAVFSVTNGVVMPKKHVALGLAIKSMTGSKQVVQILNRLGHVINYCRVEEIETEIANAISSKASNLPDSVKANPYLSTYLAFDNFDENCDTLSGHGSLHHTVGICTQLDMNTNLQEKQSNNEDQSSIAAPKSKRPRKFEFRENELEPYLKKPKLSFIGCDPSPTIVPNSFTEAEMRDSLWIFLVKLCGDKCPMWRGFNSLTVNDNTPIHTVSYMKNYATASTNPSMLLETLKVSLDVADECNQTYAVVTYDLNMAKPALQIHFEQSPRFDRVFINFGSFHLFMAFFAAIGKIIAESGGPQLIAESKVIGHGSLKGFLSGRHYNRCKRIHVIFAASLLKCHLDSFFDKNGPISDEVMNFFQSINEDPSKLSNLENVPNEVKSVIDMYNIYSDETRTGQHGSTAQFWIQYTDLITTYMKITRAVKLNDIELFVHMLPIVTNLFFVTNHHNYARWMTLYHQNLRNLDSKFPGLRDEIRNNGGFLSIKRTKIPFSAVPVDQTLEQTVNRDAASRLTGTVAFNTLHAARMRWTVTRTSRSKIVSHVKELVGMNSKEDVSQELRPTRIVRDHQDIDNLCAQIKGSANPFASELNDSHLYNLQTGRAAKNETKDFLLNFMKTGEMLRTSFLQEAIANPDRFEEPIKRQKLLTFETEGVKFKVRAGKNVKEVSLTAALFAKLCCLCLKNNIQLETALSYPLTPVSQSLANIDGSMNKTDKSQLMHHLEKSGNHTEPTSVDYTIVDGMFFLHTLPQDLPLTYGDLSAFILQKLKTFKSSRIDIIFDRYLKPSVKRCERMRRGLGVATADVFTIKGPQMLRPTNFRNALRSDTFKAELVKFLAEDWKSPQRHQYLGNIHLVVAFEESCYSLQDGSITIETGMECSHEEADTRMFFHFSKYCDAETNKTRAKNVVVRTNDTDVMIIFLGNMAKMSDEKIAKCPVWLNLGTGTSRRFVNINSIIKELGKKIATALPAYHLFTGSDFTSAFWRKGKIRPLQIMKTIPTCIDTFSKLGSSENISEEDLLELEKFTCLLYGQKGCVDINQARVNIFLKRYDCIVLSELTSTSKVEASSLPPCRRELIQKLKRCNFISFIWNHASFPRPELLTTMRPENSGWFLTEEGDYSPLWFEGPQLPEITNIDCLDTDDDGQSDNERGHSDSDSTDDEHE